MAHLFAGPGAYDMGVIERLRAENEELTPDVLLSENIFTSPDNPDDYEGLKQQLAFHKKRDRFCYIQTPGFFEPFNDIFGIENQLMYLALYPEELAELYRRQAQWTVRFADHCIDCGVDMVHLSDDWGAQKDLMFSPDTWWELIYPNMKQVVDHVHDRGCFASLHSDGCVKKVAEQFRKDGMYRIIRKTY